MHVELGQPLGSEGDQTGVVRSGADLGEVHVVVFDEHLDTEDAAATEPAVAERRGDACSHRRGAAQRGLAHRLRLPRLDVVTLLLTVSDRCAEIRAETAGVRIDGAHGQQGDLVVEIDETFDDDPSTLDATAGDGVVPGPVDLVRPAHHTLTLARRRHHRFDHTREPDPVGRGADLVGRIGERVRRRRKTQPLVGQPTDALAVHRQGRGTRGGDHLGQTVFVDLDEDLGGDGLDLGDHEVGLLGLDHGTQCARVGHVHHV